MDAENHCGVDWCTALLCIVGGAFPCVKIGYRLFEIASEDVATQILFAGCRFTLAVLAGGAIMIICGLLFGGRFPTVSGKGMASRSVWLYEPGVWCDLIRIIAE